MIELKDICKVFDKTIAVDHISLNVKEGETMVLLGTSGCGKTTTLKLINKLLTPTSGNIFIRGEEISALNAEELRRDMGYVLQNIGLFPHYTILENISVVPNLLGWSKKAINDRASILLEKLHLPLKYLNMRPSALSGGQQQRVGLARALAANPPILLMDEPFGALDNVTRTKIHHDFLELDELKTKTIVMVTHDVQEAFTLADRICLMHNGKIVQIGTPKELLFNPSDAFAKSFLDGQRLALQFRITKLSDVGVHLPKENVESAETTIGTSSVWEAMEKLRDHGLKKLKFISSENETYAFDFETLMAAFNKYRERSFE